MADGIAIGSFDATTASPAPQDQAVPVTPSFPIKALIFWTTSQTAEGNATQGHHAMGMATGAANEWCCGFTMINAQTTTNCDKIHRNSRSLQYGTAGNPIGSLDPNFELKTLGTGTFTITWQANAPGVAYKVHYIAIGGSDVTAANVAEVTLSTLTGNSNYAHGLGATPSIVFFLCNSGTTDATATSHAKQSFGVAISSTKRWARCLNARDGQTMSALVDAMKQQKTVACVLGLTDTSGADMEIDFVSMDATNVTLNNVDAPVGAYKMAMLSIAGGSWDLGATAIPTAGAPVDQAIVSGLSFTPNLFLASSFANSSATTAIIADAEVAMGAGTSSTSELASWAFENDATINTDADHSIVSTKCYRDDTANATVADDADFKQFDAAGVTVTWTTLSGVAVQVCWVAARVTDAPADDADMIAMRRISIIPLFE